MNRLEKIRNRLNNTNGSKWTYRHCGEKDDPDYEAGYDWWIEGLDYRGCPLRICSHYNTNHANGHFIAHAKEDIEWLIDQLEEQLAWRSVSADSLDIEKPLGDTQGQQADPSGA